MLGSGDQYTLEQKNDRYLNTHLTRDDPRSYKYLRNLKTQQKQYAPPKSNIHIPADPKTLVEGLDISN